MKKNLFYINPIFHDRRIKLFSDKVAENYILEIIQALDDYISERNKLERSKLTECVIKYYGEKLKKIPNFLKILHSESILNSDLKNALIHKKIDLFANKTVLNQINLERDYDFMYDNFTRDYVVKLLENCPISSIEIVRPPALAPINRYVKLKLEQVYCIELTKPKGPDSISLGGVFISPKGDVKKLAAFKVKNFTGKYDFENYNPRKVLFAFPIGETRAFPEYCNATIILAEQDSDGGFPEFLEYLRALFALSIATDLKLAGFEPSGTGISDVGLVSLIIGAPFIAIIDFIIRVILAARLDDIFPPQNCGLLLPSGRSNFGGTTTSNSFKLTFVGHGGKYDTWLHWELGR